MHLENSIARRRQSAKQRDFIVHFERSGNVLASARLAGVSRQLVYYWRETSPAFAERLSAAAGEAFGETLASSQPSGRKSARRGPGSKLERSVP
jgi:hypothetical protein